MIDARNHLSWNSLVTTLAIAATFGSPAAADGPCETGGCEHVTADPCWKLVSRQCLATPGLPSFTHGPAMFVGIGDAVDCDACQLDDGEGVIDITVGQETGVKFCVTLEAGVKLSAGASACGFSVGGEVSGSVGTQWCVDTKHWVEHQVKCKCPAGSLVHCRTLREVVPIRVSVPIDYSLIACFARRYPSGAPRCDPPANGMTGFTHTFHCGSDLKTASDTRLRITAAFATGECLPPVDADTPVESKPEG